MNDLKVNQIAELIKNSKNTVVLTGAGVSTGSGIPDFRTPGKGLWEKVDPYEVTSINAFYENPKRFYYFYRPRIEMLFKVLPNPAHKAIAQLEAMGFVKCLITQNIDDLHQKSGSKKMIKIHGTLDEAICTKCKKIISSTKLLEKINESQEEIPRCNCGGLFKPNVVLFGEMLPYLDEVINTSRKSELMLIIGSSLQVSPVNMLPQYCLENGGKLVIVNYMSTHFDHLADVTVKEDVCSFLPEVIETLKNSTIG